MLLVKHSKHTTRKRLAVSCLTLLVAACGSDDKKGSSVTDGGTQRPDASDDTSGETSDDDSSGTSTQGETTDTGQTTDDDTSLGMADAGTDSDSTTGRADGGDETTTGPGDDGGTVGGDGGDASPLPGVSAIVAEAQGDLVGYPAVLDGTGSEASDGTELEYAWEIIAVPPTSTVTSSDLADAAAAATTFLPDVAGEYTVRLTVTAGDASESTEATLTATAYDVGYLAVSGDAVTSTRYGAMVRSDGTNVRAVTCEVGRTETSEQAWVTDFRGSGQYQLRGYLPTDPTETSRLAFAYENDDDELVMQIASAQTDCADDQPVSTIGGFLPVFSPDGSRVAFSVPGEASAQTLHTIGSDGEDLRTIRTEASGTTAIAMSWTQEGELIWVESVSGGDASYSVVYRTADEEDAFTNDAVTDVLLDCSTAANPIPTITQVVLREGSLYVASLVINDSTASRSIWRLTPTATSAFSCDSEAMTNLMLVDGNGWDLEVSADGLNVLYYSQVEEADPPETQLFVIASDASSEPKLLAAGEGVTNTGAHFAAGGKQVIFTNTVFETVDDAERPVSSSVWVVNTDGSSARKLVETTSTETEARMLHTGGTSACSLGVNRASGVALSGFLVGLAALVSRRRRRSARA